jgi:UDP-N-acetylmuramate--alanine ligase
MNLEQIKNIYFVGIGGIGMSALARYFKSLGKNVAGYDKTETALTKELVKEGMQTHYNDCILDIPEDYRNKDNTLIINTPAVPQDHQEFTYVRENGFEIKKRAEVLGIISNTKEVLAIAGTHGKTTTSTMVSSLTESSDIDCSAFWEVYRSTTHHSSSLKKKQLCCG